MYCYLAFWYWGYVYFPGSYYELSWGLFIPFAFQFCSFSTVSVIVFCLCQARVSWGPSFCLIWVFVFRSLKFSNSFPSCFLSPAFGSNSTCHMVTWLFFQKWICELRHWCWMRIQFSYILFFVMPIKTTDCLIALYTCKVKTLQ